MAYGRSSVLHVVQQGNIRYETVIFVLRAIKKPKITAAEAFC